MFAILCLRNGATVSAFSKDGAGIRDAVVVLKNPNLAGGNLTFDVQVLEGDLTGADRRRVRLRPATPVSYAGVARRSTVGVGAGGVGGPASGVGVLPGMGAGQAGVGYSGGVGVNLGGPVNRVGVR